MSSVRNGNFREHLISAPEHLQHFLMSGWICRECQFPITAPGKRNNFRLPAYHRLDIAATMKGRQGKKIQAGMGIRNL